MPGVCVGRFRRKRFARDSSLTSLERRPTKANQERSRSMTKEHPKLKLGKGQVYQLKITLADIKPPVWRRIETQDCTLAKLDHIIQIVMGWDGYHLWAFDIQGEQYGNPERDP